MSGYQKALEAAIAAAREAGEILRTEFHRPGGPRGERDHADADTVAEEAIRTRLLAAAPWHYLGEELGSLNRGGVDQATRHRWLVDPNDGTRAYLKGLRGSAVSIAALRDGVPVLGVVYAFGYPDDEGDLIAWAEGCGPLVRNGRPVESDLSAGGLDEHAVVLLSQDADRRALENLRCIRPARFMALPSIAYRLARVAAGDAVAAVSLSGPGAWDYGAGHALLRAAQGVFVDEQGREVTYAASGESRTHWCFGGGPAAVAELRHRDWRGVLKTAHARAEAFPLIRPSPGMAVADAGILSRAQGCLAGQLAGDSLGGLVEFSSQASIRKQYPDGVRELRDGGHWNILAGQPTDDSEMALSLARCLARQGRYDPALARDAYVHWYRSPPFDIGTTTSRALGSSRPDAVSQSNGSLMRISPLGIFGAGRPREAATWARQDSLLTHPHPICQEACAAFVAAIATAISQGCGPRDCHKAAVLEASRPEGSPAVRAALERAAGAPPDDYETHMGWVLIALQNAFYQLLHAPTLEAGVIDTVGRGGDTDTNGAIAGALLGAVHGRNAVPPRWLQSLLTCRPLKGTPTAHPRPPEFWPVDALQLAERLLANGRATANPNSL